MFCQKCGEKVPNDSEYCNMCGEKLFVNKGKTISEELSDSDIKKIEERLMATVNQYEEKDQQPKISLTNLSVENYSKKADSLNSGNETNWKDKIESELLEMINQYEMKYRPNETSLSSEDQPLKADVSYNSNKSNLLAEISSLVFIIIVIILGIGFYNNYKSSGNIESSISDTIYSSIHNSDADKNLIQAWEAAKSIVKEDITSPSTAKFPTISVVNYTKIKDSKYNLEYVFESYVDCQNAFGAQVRTNFKIDIYLYNGKWYGKYVE